MRRLVGHLWGNLVLRFAVLALVVLTILGLVLGARLSERIRGHALGEATQRALITGGMLAHELSSATGGTTGHEDLVDGTGPAGHEDLVDGTGTAGPMHPSMPATSGGIGPDLLPAFERHLVPAGIPEAHVWSGDAELLFSSGEGAHDGVDRASAATIRDVLRSGTPSSHVEDLAAHGDHHSLAGDAFVTLIPTSIDGDEQPDVVLELVRDFAPTAAAINAELKDLGATLLLGFLALYATLVPIVAGASRRLRRAMEEQAQQVEQLEEAEGVKNTFLEAVSHEMRTPLTVVRGMLDLLAAHGTQLPAQRRQQIVVRARDNSVRLERLMLNLLDVDRLTRRVVAAREDVVRLDQTVHAALEPMQLSGHPVHVETEPCVIIGDAGQIERIVENLVSNAVKYTPAATPIWVRVRVEGDDAVLLVEDAGPGIAPEFRERVFEVFERVHDQHHAPGTGVGLALVEGFASMHDGRAWVEEREGGGASFRVSLPLGDPAVLPDPDEEIDRPTGGERIARGQVVGATTGS